MEFIRENIIKIIIFVVVLIVGIFIVAFIFGNNNTSKAATYTNMETKLLNAAKKYANNHPKLLPKEDNESNKINLDTLVNEKYIKDLTAIEDSNISCSGYVDLIYKNKNVVYVPYLKCGKYYKTKTIADYVISNQSVVTSGDGLYKLGTNYVFRGENPNNYLGMGERLYRIVEINDKGEVKLISNKRFNEYLVWDDRYNTEKDDTVGINVYSKSRLKDSLNNVININSTDPKSEYYYFSSQEMEKMIPHDICVGKRPSTYGAISEANECQVVEKDQKLSLITVSEYARASIDSNCRTIFDKSCMNYNYFSQMGDVFRTVTAITDNTYQVFYINDGVAEIARASSSFSSHIIIYIDNLSLYADGDGTYENPYTIR